VEPCFGREGSPCRRIRTAMTSDGAGGEYRFRHVRWPCLPGQYQGSPLALRLSNAKREQHVSRDLRNDSVS
jgi:hypothetical protein